MNRSCKKKNKQTNKQTNKQSNKQQQNSTKQKGKNARERSYVLEYTTLPAIGLANIPDSAVGDQH